jgi:hypothetical protein
MLEDLAEPHSLELSQMGRQNLHDTRVTSVRHSRDTPTHERPWCLVIQTMKISLHGVASLRTELDAIAHILVGTPVAHGSQAHDARPSDSLMRKEPRNTETVEPSRCQRQRRAASVIDERRLVCVTHMRAMSVLWLSLS